MSWAWGPCPQHLGTSHGVAEGRVPAATLPSQPARPVWSPAHSRKLAEQVAEQHNGQLFFHRCPRRSFTPGTPGFHGGTSISLLSSLNNQNSCPV